MPWLDAARGLGVIAMVFGHTLDGLLSPAARASPFIVEYWKARGLTAPLFLMVAGWAVTLAVSRSPMRGWPMIRARLPRVALLLTLGYALHLPGWDFQALLSGERAMWRQFLAFDALQVVAVGYLGALLVHATGWSEARRASTFALLGTGAVVLGMCSLPVRAATLPGLALVQAIAGTSPFPIVPWLAYFFFGAAGSLIAKDPRARWAAGLLSVGAYATASFGWHGFGNMPPAHPLLVSFRVGAVLLLLAFLEVLPSRAAAVLARLAKYSLNVYVIHVPVVYGWFTLQGLSQRIGPRLAFHEAALMALAVLAAAIAAAAAMRRVAGAARGWLLFTRCSSTAHPGSHGACSERVLLSNAAP